MLSGLKAFCKFRRQEAALKVFQVMCNFSQQEEKREFYSLTTLMEAVFIDNFSQQTLFSLHVP